MSKLTFFLGFARAGIKFLNMDGPIDSLFSESISPLKTPRCFYKLTVKMKRNRTVLVQRRKMDGPVQRLFPGVVNEIVSRSSMSILEVFLFKVKSLLS